MGFGMTPGSELYLSYLPETIVLPWLDRYRGRESKNSAAYVDRLSRKYEYSGPAWYQREVTVPAGWTGRDVELELGEMPLDHNCICRRSRGWKR